jgi:transposase InsO family protein
VLVELGVAEQRYRAVLEVLDGAPVTVVARRYGVSRQTVHRWLARYAGEGGLANLVDRSSRPGWCPHQMPAAVEVRVIGLRWQHRDWGPDRIRYQLAREGVVPVPGRSSVYRALVRNRLLDPVKRKRKRSDYRRWERGRAMELWQMDVMGGVHLADGCEVKVVTGIDDHSRFVVCARVVARATAGPVCAALQHALTAHGVPEQILTDNGKVFTARFGLGPGPVRFDRICVENGIRHLLTAPYSPTTTGKVERLHKTMRAEFFRGHERAFASIAELQAALDGWVVHYNCERPHQAVGMCPPADRFRLAPKVLPAAVADDPGPSGPEPAPAAGAEQTRPPGVSRWVDQAGQVSVAGFRYPVGRAFAGEPVEVVVTGGLVEILHAGVLVATRVQRRRPDHTGAEHGVDQHRVDRPLVTQRRARRPGVGPSVVRVADANGAVSFAGVMYRAGRAWARRSIEVSLVAGSVQLACDGQVIRVHAARHDPAKEHGAFATPNGRPRKPKPAPQADHVADLPNSIRRTGTGT